MQTLTSPQRRGADPLAELCETVLSEGRALDVDPEALLRATAEAFEFLFARSSGIARTPGR
jgi:hypothetical protein